MRVLLDTSVLLWWLADDPALSEDHRRQLARAQNTIYVSAVTLAEVSVKHSLGKLALPELFDEAVAGSGFDELPFTGEHAAQLRTLPWHHRDPFDRMLIAQAKVEGLTFATIDPRCARYGVQIL
jgi:PIN domain nuclease of toxin-antitoxin system